MTTAQTPGTRRATNDGSKFTKVAVTTSAPTGPSGAARKAKYPFQKPVSPASAAAACDSAAK
ncbi:hypothetical protein E4P43_18150 [Blastococcus sp. TF02A-35]|nr:hypothetical protein E4P43_18150 [Blastococcus sp. TF02A_35]